VAARLWARLPARRLLRVLDGSGGVGGVVADGAPLGRAGAGAGAVSLGGRRVAARPPLRRLPLGRARLLAVPAPARDPDRRARGRPRRVVRAARRERRPRRLHRAALAPAAGWHRRRGGPPSRRTAA